MHAWPTGTSGSRPNSGLGDAVAGDQPEALRLAGDDQQGPADGLGEEQVDLGRQGIEQVGDADRSRLLAGRDRRCVQVDAGIGEAARSTVPSAATVERKWPPSGKRPRCAGALIR